MLLGAELIRTVVREIAEELRDGPERVEILVVGGSTTALRGLRQGTADVDSASRLPQRVAHPNEPEDEHLEAFVASVAGRSTA